MLHAAPARPHIDQLVSQGVALICTGDAHEAAKKLKNASKAHKAGLGSKELRLLIKDAIKMLPVTWCCEYWAACIARGQAPNPLSSRDGRQLKLVPKQWALSQSAVAKNLQKVIGDLHTMQAGLLCTAWGTCRQPDKASLALMRGFAYAQAGRYEQALKDVKVVLAYAPKHPQQKGICSWPLAHALHSAALEGLQDNVVASLAMQIAHELDPACQRHLDDLERLMRRIPLTIANVLEAEGSAGLRTWLAEEEERKKPEFMKQRPKYYYYYEWMKERICATRPALPEPVMDKLLTMPANDLDLILQHKEATTWKVDELMGVLEEGGPALLEGYSVQGLSWEQVKVLKGPDLVGLGLGSSLAPGEDLLENGAEGCEQSKLQAPTQELSADSHGGTAPGSHSHSTPGDAGNAGDEDEDEDLDAVTL